MLIARVDRACRYVFVNDAYAARFGVPPSALVGRSVSDVIGAALYAAVAPRMVAVLAGERVDFELAVPGPTGEPIVLRAVYEPERGDDGTVSGFIGVIDDVSAGLRVERALRESEATLRAFYESAPTCMGLVELTDDGDILHVSDNVASCRFFGVAAGATSNRRASALGATAATIAAWRERYRESAERGEPVRFEHSFETTAGARWLAVSVSVVPRPLGEPRRFCYVADDVTARRAVQQELVEREAEFRTLADNMSQFAWTAEPSGYIDWYNRRWFDYTGTTLDEMRGWGWQAVHHPDHVARVVENFRTCIESGEPWEDTFPLRGRDGAYRWFLSRAIPITDDSGGIVRWFGTNTDITAQREAEQALRVADQRKDEFLATLAHELRNPLSPIRNAVEVMERKAITDPDLAWCRDVIHRQMTHLTRLVDDLLDVSRVTHGRLELRTADNDLGTILANAIEASRPFLAARAHRLEYEPAPDALTVSVDDVRLVQVFTNLLNNSAKYTDRGGCIRISIRRLDEAVEVSVRDDGIGIAADVLPHVFDMFTQATPSHDERTGGLGIGLTLARQLVELHGGGITAHSDGLGRGSEFRVRLPFATSRPAGTAVVERPTKARDCARILVADDNADSADSLAMLLELRGHEVGVAHDGLEALAVAETLRPHVAFLDLGMPEVDGYEVGRRLRARFGTAVRLVALTGWGQERDRERTRDAGFDAHVVKPLDIAELERLLSEPR